jgi:hypothetical protein
MILDLLCLMVGRLPAALSLRQISEGAPDNIEDRAFGGRGSEHCLVYME